MSARLPVLGAFDSEHPPSAEDVDDCVHCGFCLPTCPTYVLWGREMDSPRGRIHLVKVALEGSAGLDRSLSVHFDRCLGCMGCLTACPSGVRYDAILEATRAQLERHVRRPWSEWWMLGVLRHTLPYRGRLRWMLRLGVWARRLGLLGLADRLGVSTWWPSLSAASALVPSAVPARRPVTAVGSSGRMSAARKDVRRVGLLEGCVQSVLFEEVHAATEKVLSKVGFEVVRISNPECCGALDMHSGRPDLVRPRVEGLARTLEAERLEFLVTNAAGCGSALKTAARLFSAGTEGHRRATELGRRVRDAIELVDTVDAELRLGPVAARVAYHDACHLTHAQGLAEAPRRMLRRVPELELVEVEESAICCGSAGIYNLTQPRAAAELGARKAGHLAAARPDIVAAANPGCTLQIRAHLPEIPILHPMQILARAVDAKSRS